MTDCPSFEVCLFKEQSSHLHFCFFVSKYPRHFPEVPFFPIPGLTVKQMVRGRSRSSITEPSSDLKLISTTGLDTPFDSWVRMGFSFTRKVTSSSPLPLLKPTGISKNPAVCPSLVISSTDWTASFSWDSVTFSVPPLHSPSHPDKLINMLLGEGIETLVGDSMA